MANIIQIKRGAQASLPTLSAGELGFSTDSHRVFIGDGAANHEMARTVIDSIIQAATDTLTAVEVNGKIITNYGQSGANTQTLPAAAEGMNFIAVISTAGQGAFNIKAGASDKIYLDGTALDDGDKVSCATPVVGDYITFWTFLNGSSVYDWIAASGQGTWTDGGA